MYVLVVSGSPRMEGLCHKISMELANGVKSAGGDVELVLLAGKRIEACRACGTTGCWSFMECSIQDDALELRRKFNDCDAFALVAPVYFLSVNGLTKNFIDRMRYYGENGKPAAVAAVAGGTGKGCIYALQEMCRWLVLVGFRPVSIMPVTRYNFETALVEARFNGSKLVNINRQPFASLSEKLVYLESLPYMKYEATDEMLYLARQAIHALARKGRIDLAGSLSYKIEEAETLRRLGLHQDALRLSVEVQEESMRLFNSLMKSG
ncbi:MAG: flavodoxin family protein [Thermofilaceae archaeon]|nr:flavodoxin family protein [Thermofilaceae archaeon]MCX8179802.1 flavodoxin family protein [Thermofilaceae archaeon]MDW8004329.1 flavodoxin family protein [Thermofilaceae archaeon]